MASMLGKTWHRRQVPLTGKITVLVLEEDKALSDTELLAKVFRKHPFFVLNEGDVTFIEEDEWVKANTKELP